MQLPRPVDSFLFSIAAKSTLLVFLHGPCDALALFLFAHLPLK